MHHVITYKRVESSSRCFPRELVSFVRPRELLSFDLWHVTRSNPWLIGKVFELGGITNNNNFMSECSERVKSCF